MIISFIIFSLSCIVAFIASIAYYTKKLHQMEVEKSLEIRNVRNRRTAMFLLAIYPILCPSILFIIFLMYTMSFFGGEYSSMFKELAMDIWVEFTSEYPKLIAHYSS